MSIDHLKKQAKNLKKCLPDFLKAHPDGVAPLAQYQELIAKASGYPSWHAAAKAKHLENPDDDSGFPSIAVRVVLQRKTVTEFTKSGKAKAPVEFECARFQPSDHKLLSFVTASLDQFLDEAGTSDEFGVDGPPVEHSQALERLCRQLIQQDPCFIDGFAHLGNALFWLRRHEEAIEVCQPIFDQLCELLPKDFEGRVAYSDMANRPFFRLAHALVLAHYGLGTQAGNKRALSLIRQMLKLWPNDNLGFRHLLTPP